MSRKDLGELILVIGDLCIPNRAEGIPAALEKLLGANCVKYVLCTGNICSKEVLPKIQKFGSVVHIVRGDLDDEKELSYPFQKTVKIGGFKFGLIHGHQIVPWGDTESLAALQRKMGVDILISGHTHNSEVVEYQGGWLINPGSATGAFNATNTKSNASFLVLSVKSDEFTVFEYKLNGKKVLIKSRTLKKATESLEKK
ncbi:hypothetical protein AAMO2058_001003500 [Amorphochlora amoebiformis]